MTEAERIARAHRAKSAWDEFIEPMLSEMEAEYTARLAEVASSELHPGNRADKITTLATALRVTSNIKNGMQAAMLDGEMAQRDKLRAEKIEKMSDAQQRLLKITGY